MPGIAHDRPNPLAREAARSTLRVRLRGKVPPMQASPSSCRARLILWCNGPFAQATVSSTRQTPAGNLPASGGWQHSDSRIGPAPTEVGPALPPGRYRLRIFGEAVVERNIDVDLEEGKTSELVVPVQRP